MVAFFFPMLSGANPLFVEFLGSNASTSAGSSQSFAGESLGVAVSSREIFVAVSWKGGLLLRTLSSATIGGVAATIRVQNGLTDGAGLSIGAAVISAVVPTGATGTIAITFSGSVDDCGIGKYRVLNRTSIFNTASDALTDASPPATSSTNINVGQNGAIIAGYQLGDGGFGSGVTWGNINEDYDAAFSANYRYSGASQSGLSAQTGRSITTSSNASGSAGITVAIVSIT
ncbi:hypothetical protein EN866_32885 [Mesorhizobium sp. M2D.F.Ca.ET.223.01.1.1]|uniref:hypothetical protein n=1 Tax=Mesorhizobium sp. M2D.F.Ca.ET.223.01.1.1 TaxID=2563940 RepID=UPI0010932917|nr:hypothetical protein [Mesorhizobium sp. M2D.F.Ca.ET.223.01.1.1]TGR84604.1 hypothetical protein EN866_32885 [Mesorhizobium sp. M2D.F.Ca.ET.223.01.1.1]TGT64511.1 hypothetical protein EN802_32500 [bacterium M00.F.Ca.ET.159.01.1.1]TGT79356.1 hypothetical protein EN800_31840 [bacterium M00.F.Ca.ET.157.01.1.1]